MQSLMDIAALASNLSLIQAQSHVGVAVAKTSGDAVKQQGDAAVALMQQAVELQRALNAQARGGVDVMA